MPYDAAEILIRGDAASDDEAFASVRTVAQKTQAAVRAPRLPPDVVARFPDAPLSPWRKRMARRERCGLFAVK
jgi:hypothetical protein